MNPRLLNFSLSVTALLTAAVLPLAGIAAQTRVDHRSHQTPLRPQGGRYTCTSFSAVAALEARLKRLGYGDLDLSEEFLSYFDKMFWLHPNWDNDPPQDPPVLGTLGADHSETQVGAFGGGGGVGKIRHLTAGMRVPAEEYMPYRREGYVCPPYMIGGALNPHWFSQRHTSDFNLDPRNLPRSALTAPRYFSARSVVVIGAAAENEIVAALRSGYDVVWDFYVGGTRPDNALWRPIVGESVAGLDGHSMLIVGYDFSSSDRNQHHYIVKNSWGATGASASAGGYTLIHRDYLRYGYRAAYVSAVNAPSPWPELAFIGRRNLCLDGFRGTLDIYHLPGLSQMYFDDVGLRRVDRRLGTFYDDNGGAHRVNGFIAGRTMTFWYKSGTAANMPWDEVRDAPTLGRLFVYHLVGPQAGDLAGWHMDNPGDIPDPAWGGYARLPSTILGSDGFFVPVNNAAPWSPEMYLGIWNFAFNDVPGEMEFEFRDDDRVPIGRRAQWAGLVMAFTPLGSSVRRSVVAEVQRADPRVLHIAYNDHEYARVDLNLYMLSHQRGVFAGDGTVNGVRVGAAGVRVGMRVHGRFETMGTGCGGLIHAGIGQPERGQTVHYVLSGAPANTIAQLALGVRYARPTDLTFLGSPGCWLYVNPLLGLNTVTSSTGEARLPIGLPASWPIGATLDTTFITLGGLAGRTVRTSNGLATVIGGIR